MAESNTSLEGKVILVTGAFGLIGRAVSRSFLSAGATLVAAGHNPEAVADRQRELAAEFGTERLLVTALELTSQTSVDQCVARTIEQIGN